jgi:tRNA1Val (adenine37-N6)-methyltransferase
MRVNTDGCLLAAWARAAGDNILDVGTGSGVIALMMAQRNPLAVIEGVDIDANSCADAEVNFAASPWQNRLTVHCADFLHIAFPQKFDLIISNPPFFSNGLKPTSHERKVSRHADSLPALSFLKKAKSCLSENGRIAIVIPAGEFRLWETIALAEGLSVGRICHVSPDAEKPVHRIMAELGVDLRRQEQLLPIRNSAEEYSVEFQKLLKDFYLYL